jgi:hypothetical protein
MCDHEAAASPVVPCSVAAHCVRRYDGLLLQAGEESTVNVAEAGSFVH